MSASRVGSPHRALGASLAGALCLSSCGQVIGVDDYSVVEPPIGAEVLPILPALPDSSPADIIPTCTKCVAEKCDDERKACLGSAQCKRLLECTGGGAEPCDDPNCLARCKDENPPSVLFDAYFACAFGIFNSPCQVECNVGNNWGCTHDFTWDKRDLGKVEESVSIVDQMLSRTLTPAPPLATVVDVVVAPCGESIPDAVLRGDFGCSSGFPVDRFGHANLFLDPFQSVLSITGGEEEQTRYYPRPISRSGRLTLTFANNYFLRDILQRQIMASSSQSIVVYHGNDCLGPAQVGVTMSPAPSAPTKVFYWDTDNQAHLDPLDERKSTSGGFINVPGEQRVTIQGIRRKNPTKPQDTEEVISTSPSVVVAAGWTTVVDLYPLDFTNH